MKKVLLYLIVGLVFTGCTTKQDYVLFNDTNVTKPNAKKSVTPIDRTIFEYKIQPHDRISITMYNHPELGTSSVQSQRQDTKGVLVNARGYVRLPLVKSVHVAGLTQTAAQKKIEKAFGQYLEDAEVYLEVLNKRAYILGEVNKQGEMDLFNEKLSLLQILAKAGGFTDYANRKSIVILKNRNKKMLTETVNMTGINSIKMANIMIYPNDIIYVPPTNLKPVNTSIGQISPSLQLINNILAPVVSARYLSNN
ncbi:MAG TPA: polysaccharide export protein [Arcobacter sp.]|nr:polysaccharide export protein [Arcobacter sp.]